MSGGSASTSQRRHFWLAHRRLHDRMSTFVEIQQGPNPLAPEEVRRLIERDPERYGIFERYAGLVTSGTQEK